MFATSWRKWNEMVLPKSSILAFITVISIVGYLHRLDFLALFWTGFYYISLEKTDDPKEKARLYFLLGDWEKRVELDKKHGFISTTLHYTQHHTGTGKLYADQMVMLEFLYFLDSIDSLIGVGEAALALKFARKYNPSTNIEEESINRIIEILENQIELIREQKDYIEIATDVLRNVKLDDVDDPGIYFRYSSFILLGQAFFMVRAWYQNRISKRYLYLQILVLFFSLLWFLFFNGIPPLERFLTVSTIVTFGKSFLLPPSDAAHWPCPNLERSRQFFLKYPYNYEDLSTRQSLNLLSQVFSLQLKKCNYPVRSEENEIESCYSAHKLAYAIAKMMEVDKSRDFLQHRDLWYADIRITLEEEVLKNVSIWPGQLYFSNTDLEPLQADYIRKTIDEWLLTILQGENIDPTHTHQTFHGTEHIEL